MFGDDDGSELDALRLHVSRYRRRYFPFHHSPIKFATKNLKHHDPENSDRDQTSRARDGIVDARGDADTLLRDGVHHRGGKRSDADRHTQSEKEDSREKSCPIATARARQNEKRETRCGYQWADDQRKFRSVNCNESARPARKERNGQDKWQQRRPRGRGRVMLHLNQIQR